MENDPSRDWLSEFYPGVVVRHRSRNQLGAVLFVDDDAEDTTPPRYELHVDTDEGVEIWEPCDAVVVRDFESRAEAVQLGLRGVFLDS